MQPPPSSTTTPKSIDQLRSLLRRVLRITTSDDRVFMGAFAGTDKSLNLLLINTEEFRLGMGDMYEGRYVGQVLIPWRVVVKAEAQSQRGDADNRDASYV
ncbi:hypothetical protein FA15DRAFT_675029 [Coprinopsis marcescibilis]|uniref:Sm domain-containing protein n=1 Tax=Coprinopsis marcescibilis TaxID=230819 RepID=A0A5C3KFD1_COPMA|nr:hypothetical protein FA15DRAFT_675029 [Coprinopsis marcescibilis]